MCWAHAGVCQILRHLADALRSACATSSDGPRLATNGKTAFPSPDHPASLSTIFVPTKPVWGNETRGNHLGSGSCQGCVVLPPARSGAHRASKRARPRPSPQSGGGEGRENRTGTCLPTRQTRKAYPAPANSHLAVGLPCLRGCAGPFATQVRDPDPVKHVLACQS